MMLDAPTSTQTRPCSSRSWEIALARMRSRRTSTSTPSASTASSNDKRVTDVLSETRARSSIDLTSSPLEPEELSHLRYLPRPRLYHPADERLDHSARYPLPA